MAAVACRHIREQKGPFVRKESGRRASLRSASTVPVYPSSQKGDYKYLVKHSDGGAGIVVEDALCQRSGGLTKPKLCGVARTLQRRPRSAHLLQRHKRSSTPVRSKRTFMKVVSAEKAREGIVPEAEKADCTYAQTRAHVGCVGKAGYDVGQSVFSDTVYRRSSVTARACAPAEKKVHSYGMRPCLTASFPPQYESAFLWVICAELELPKAFEGLDLRVLPFEIFGYSSSVPVGSVCIGPWSARGSRQVVLGSG